MLIRLINRSLPFFVIFFGLISCNPQIEEDNDEETPLEIESKMKFHELKDDDFEIITIDECEYIVYQHNAVGSNHGFGFMAHKGNCINPVHIYKTPSVPIDQDSTLIK